MRYRRLISKGFALLCLITLIVVLLTYVLIREPQPLVKLVYNPPVISNKYTTILFWNAFFEESNWYLPNETNTVQCPLATCIFTSRHDYLPNVEAYNALVIHTARKLASYPKIRHINQLYIMALLESPHHTAHDLQRDDGFFNLTMTYRLDSDIIWNHYGQVLNRTTSEVVAPQMNPPWLSDESAWMQFEDDKLLSFAKQKWKFAAWFVSNCHTASKREDFVEELSKHIGVDIYGKCGRYECKRFEDECDEMLDKEYKFYLSFENSLCVDYVTEKFYTALQRMVVPVVYGGANYTRFAPPQSYINARDFDNPEELAQYLLYLAENPEEYVKYFWWRRFYKIVVPQDFPPCRVCHFVSQQTQTQQPKKYYKDIYSYWHRDACQAT